MDEIKIPLSFIMWVVGGTVGFIWILLVLLFKQFEARINAKFKNLEEDVDLKFEGLGKELEYRELKMWNHLYRSGVVAPDQTPPSNS